MDIYDFIDKNFDKCNDKDISNGDSITYKQDRIIVGITNRSKSNSNLLSRNLYNNLSFYPKLLKHKWVIETISPIPILSLEIDNYSKNALRELFDYYNKVDFSYRIIAGIGSVEFGLIGANNNYAFGSVGEIVSLVVEACVFLKRELSWGDSNVIDLLDYKRNEGYCINNQYFYPIKTDL